MSKEKDGVAGGIAGHRRRRQEDTVMPPKRNNEENVGEGAVDRKSEASDLDLVFQILAKYCEGRTSGERWWFSEKGERRAAGAGDDGVAGDNGVAGESLEGERKKEQSEVCVCVGVFRGNNVEWERK